MATNQDPIEAEKDRRQAQEWMQPPLTDQPTPVAESSILAATIALGESTSQLTEAVLANRRERRALQWVAGILAVLFVAAFVFGAIVMNKLADVVEQNGQLFATVNSVTNEKAQQASIARADYRTQLTIYCTNNFLAHTTDPNGIALDARCPTTFPALPATPPND